MGFWDNLRGLFTTTQVQEHAPQSAQPETPQPQRVAFQPTDEFFDKLTEKPNAAGVVTTPDTILTITAFWRAINIIAGVIGSLPFDVYRLEETKRTKLYNHPVSRLIRRAPNPYVSKFDFFQTMILHLYVHGNFYALINRNTVTGYPVQLTILEPQNVKIDINARNEVVYEYHRDRGVKIRYAYDRVIHISGLAWDSLHGLSILDTFKDVFGTAIANQEYLSSFYKNGAHVSGVVSVPTALSDDAYKRLSQSWSARYGGVKNMGKTAILEQGAEYKRTGLNPNEAGSMDAKKMTVADIARITGVPQFLLEDLDRATFNNIEHLGLLFVTYTILPLCQNISAELSRKLLLEREQDNHEIEPDLHILMRADTENRAKLIESLMKWGIINRDEARAMEGMNPIEDGSGKAYYVPMNMMDPTKPQPEPAPAPRQPMQEPDDDDDDSNDQNDDNNDT